MSMEQELKRRLDDLGARIDGKVAAFKAQGVLHGAEREAAAEWKLQHLLSDADKAGDRRPTKALTMDFEILRLTIERFLARIEKGL